MLVGNRRQTRPLIIRLPLEDFVISVYIIVVDAAARLGWTKAPPPPPVQLLRPVVKTPSEINVCTTKMSFVLRGQDSVRNTNIRMFTSTRQISPGVENKWN